MNHFAFANGRILRRFGWWLGGAAAFFVVTVWAAEQRPVYTFGVVPQFTAKTTREVWLPILAALERETGLRFQLRVSPTNLSFDAQVLVGEFDFAYMSPFTAYKTTQKKLYVPLVKDVGTVLHGVVVVPKEASVKSLSELAGKPVAFPDPDAFGATLIIKAVLTDKYRVSVEPKYVRSHPSVYLNVALGRVAAGGGVQKTLRQQPAPVRKRLRVLYETPALPSHPIVANRRISRKVRGRVQEALLSIAATEHGKKLLLAVPIDRLGTASARDYRALGSWNLDRFYHRE